MSSLSVSKRAGRAVNASAKARAARLVRKIERAIERGEFTPDTSYLCDNPRLGPCGCARAAVEMLGVKLKPEDEAALEVGYEAFRSPSNRRLAAASPEFYDAGRELRRFHPVATEAS